MIPFFPAIEEDELLYSTVARYHRMSGWTSWSATLEALFGRRHVVAAHDLPGHLGALCGRLTTDIADPMAVADLIGRSTLIPYYTSAASPAIREAALSAAAAGGGSSHLSLGLAVSCVPRVATLRFCVECKADDLAARGFIWWRRSHQLPGTLVCLRHETVLRETPVRLDHLGRHEFLLADGRSCAPAARPLASGGPACMDLLLAIARIEEEILRSGVAGRPHGELRERLAAAGMMRSRRRVDWERLLSRAAGFFAPAGDSLPATSPEALARWMPDLLRSTRRQAHPLLHVLLQAFIDAHPPAASGLVGPFGAGPWPCLNPLASHRGQTVVTDLSSYTTRGRLVGRFACDCGYVYSRSVSRDGVRTRPRLYRYGPLLELELRRLVEMGISLRKAARKLGLDPSTVALQARRLGLPVTWRTGKDRSGRAVARPSPRPAPRGVDARRRGNRPARQDWAARDAETLVRCRHAEKVLLACEPPVRLTCAAIERKAGLRTGWIRARSRHLPRTIRFIRRTVETTDAFRRRRASFVIGRNDGPVVPWRVMRAAGLTGADLPMIRELIEPSLPERRVAA